MKLTEENLSGYLMTDLADGRRLMVWRTGIFPVGTYICTAVFERVQDEPERWLTGENDIVGAASVPEFVSRHPELTDNDWFEPDGPVDV